jgi:MFS family permease
VDSVTEYQAPLSQKAKGWAAFAPSLRSRNFRLLWAGQIVSTMGTFLQTVAEYWLLYNMTGSTFLLGVIGFIGLLPVIPISLLGGILIDRVPRRKLIMVTQFGLLAQAVIFGLLVITGQIRVWHIIVLDFMMGALFAIDMPARQAFLVELVDKNDLANAIALNAIIFQFSRVIGQAASGILIATIGVGGTMLLNAATFLAPIVCLAMMQVRDVRMDTERMPLNIALSEGAITLWKRPVLVGTVSLIATVGGLTLAIHLMMPAFAKDVLSTNAIGLGLLLASSALGSTIGTVWVAKRGTERRGHTLMVSSLLLPLLIFGFAGSRSMLATCLVLLVIGLFHTTLHAMATTLVQIHVPDRVRGRVMSLYSMLVIGTPKAAGVFIGGVAEYVGLPRTIILCNLGVLIYVVVLHVFVPSIRKLD